MATNKLPGQQQAAALTAIQAYPWWADATGDELLIGTRTNTTWWCMGEESVTLTMTAALAGRWGCWYDLRETDLIVAAVPRA
ncbi:MAG: hypothetical protein U0Y68_17955 [Blastocatellia bacterium]